MPCLCYGAVSGKEEFDKWISSASGKRALDYLKMAAREVLSHKIDSECFDEEYKKAWIKAFDHMLNGCDEH
jgi:hypothetical protein